jgi:hypothetical protein
MFPLQWRFVVMLGFIFVTASCAEKEAETAPVESGIRGESCQDWEDCGVGLSCIDNQCVVDSFPVAVSADQCQYVECTIPEQCCSLANFDCDGFLQSCTDGDSAGCANYRANCTCSAATQSCKNGECLFKCNSAQDCCPSLNINFCFELEQQCELGVPSACENYSLVGCDCDASAYTCTLEGQCQAACELDAECPGGFCQAEKCVSCRNDNDCGAGERCFGYTCIETCANNTNCPAFHTCDLVTGVCKESGCYTDKECVAGSGNVLATCQASACVVPCTTDLECDTPTNYGNLKCQDGICTDVGCETDQECKIRHAPDGSVGKGEWQCISSTGNSPF